MSGYEARAQHVTTYGDSWMNADEATAYLGYRTRAALYQAVRRGTVPAHRLGARGLRFRRSELDAKLTRSLSRMMEPFANTTE
jgi:excisionase family DNA binding protein